VASWTCTGPTCGRTVEFDGSGEALFNMRRRNRRRQWLIFTRGVIDKLVSFIITARTTYTAATRHLCADVTAFGLRRQDVVKLGTAALRVFLIPAETGRCPICGPSPKFVVIDAQALGCTDPEDACPQRLDMDCPVLDVPTAKLCILTQPSLRAAVYKVLRSAAPLTQPQAQQLRTWHASMLTVGRRSVERAAAILFFRFFPLGSEQAASGGDTGGAGDKKPAEDKVASNAKAAAEEMGAVEYTQRGRRKKRPRVDTSLEAALREDEDGNLILGGDGKPVKKPAETWRDRTGLCSPDFTKIPRDDDGGWICVIPFLQAMLAESVSGMFQGHNEKALKLLADKLRLEGADEWPMASAAADGVGFVASFLGFFSQELEHDTAFRVALGEMIGAAVQVEAEADKAFELAASSSGTLAKGWRNAEYSKRWKGTPTPADYKRWRAEQAVAADFDEDDPLVSFEFFASLPRVRAGIADSEAAKRRVQYRGQARHAADREGDGDACNKAFSVTFGLTQGVFNVVCPHVITLGFRCLFRAESVGEALSIVLERFSQLPKVIFYDVACKLDKNAMRRVRPLLRAHQVRCILDRPHSITHSCSPVYMPDDSLGSTAGVATQAAEVSHSISVGNRTSLAYMSPATYMIHRMAQVAFMNTRKLQRLLSDKPNAENDHIPLAPFYHDRLVHDCERGPSCSCQRGHEVPVNTSAAAEVPAPSTLQQPASVSGATIEAGDIELAHKDPAPAEDPPLMLVGGLHDIGNGDALSVGSNQDKDWMSDGASAHSDDDDDGADGDDGARAATLPTGQVVSIDEQAMDGEEAKDADGEGAKDEDGEEAKDADGDTLTIDHSELVERLDFELVPFTAHCPPPLTQAEMLFVSAITTGHPPGAIVRHRNKARIDVAVADVLLLGGDSWLNDQVLNSVIALLNFEDERAASSLLGSFASEGAGGEPRRRPRTRTMNTYFFTRLHSRLIGYVYQNVSSWGRVYGVDLNVVDVILIPVHVHRTHWALLKIDVEHRLFVYFDSLPGGVVDEPIDVARRWLYDELCAQLGVDIADKWGVFSWPVGHNDEDPEQEDGGSCGVFVLAAAHCYAAGLPLTFSQADIPALRCRLAIALFFDDLGGSS